MTDFFTEHERWIGLTASLIAIGLFGFGIVRWVIFRNAPMNVTVKNPDALAPTRRANIIQMTPSEFATSTREQRD